MDNINPEHLNLVKNILKKHLSSQAIIWVFGSRATNTAKKFSDLDLAIDIGQPISHELLANLLFDFEHSDLPYKVDIIDWNSINENFKKLINKEKIRLKF